MFLRIGFVFAILCALYVMLKEPIKGWLKENNPFPGYDPLVTDVTITYNEDDMDGQRLAYQLHSYLGKHGMDSIPFPVPISKQLPEANFADNATSTASAPTGVKVHINRSN